MKKLLLCALCLLIALSMPVLCFAEGGNEADGNTVMEILDIIWYVVLVVLFGGGLILVSKWSQKINARDAELEQQLLELQEAEEAAETEETEAIEGEAAESSKDENEPTEPASKD